MSRHQPVSPFERSLFHRKASAGLDLGGLNLSGLGLTAVGPSAVATPSVVLYTPPESRPIAEGLQGIYQLGKSLEKIDPIKDAPGRSDFPAISGLLEENSSNEARLWRNDALQKLEQFWNPVYHPTTESNEMIRTGTAETAAQGYWVMPLFELWKTAPTDASRDELGGFLATATSYLLPFGSAYWSESRMKDSGNSTAGFFAIAWAKRAMDVGIVNGWRGVMMYADGTDVPFFPNLWTCAGWPGLRGDQWVVVWDALRGYPVYGSDNGMAYQLQKMIANWMSTLLGASANRLWDRGHPWGSGYPMRVWQAGPRATIGRDADMGSMLALVPDCGNVGAW